MTVYSLFFTQTNSADILILINQRHYIYKNLLQLTAKYNIKASNKVIVIKVTKYRLY